MTVRDDRYVSKQKMPYSEDNDLHVLLEILFPIYLIPFLFMVSYLYLNVINYL